jgi:predicted nucleic acid-binding protein
LFPLQLLKYLAVLPIDLYIEAMRIYLDTSAINRIFDDQSQPRIYLEASAMVTILAMVENKSLSLVSSEVLFFENSRNPFEERRAFVSAVLAHAKVVQTINPTLLNRAQQIESAHGISGLDALHLACAEKLKCAYFITCDDRIVRRYKDVITAINPVQFTIEVMKEAENA